MLQDSPRRRVSLLDIPLLRIARRGDRHTVQDYRIDVAVDDAAADPTAILRSVRALATEHAGAGPEPLALMIARHVLQRSPASIVDVEVRSRGWDHVAIGGRERGGELTAPSTMLRMAAARLAVGAEHVYAGLRELELFSATDAADAVLQLKVQALWRYGWKDVPYDTQWQQVRRALIEAYAERRNAAGFALAEGLAAAVLDEAPAVSEMHVRIEQVRLPAVDLDDVGISNDGVAFGAPVTERSCFEVRRTRDEVTEIV